MSEAFILSVPTAKGVNPFAPVAIMMCNIRESYNYLRTGVIPEHAPRYWADGLRYGLFGRVFIVTPEGKPDKAGNEEYIRKCRESVRGPDAKWDTYLSAEVLDMTAEDHAAFAAAHGEDMDADVEGVNAIKENFAQMVEADKQITAAEALGATDDGQAPSDLDEDEDEDEGADDDLDDNGEPRV